MNMNRKPMDELDANGGPVHPSDISQYSEFGHRGMSLRDHFAGLAMMGCLAGITGKDNVRPFEDASVAGAAYAMADAMLKAREK